MNMAALIGWKCLLCSATATISIHLNMYNDALNANAAIVSKSTQAKELVTNRSTEREIHFQFADTT